MAAKPASPPDIAAVHAQYAALRDQLAKTPRADLVAAAAGIVTAPEYRATAERAAMLADALPDGDPLKAHLANFAQCSMAVLALVRAEAAKPADAAKA